MESVVNNDLENFIANNKILSNKIAEKSFLITGATGMIGTYLTLFICESILKAGKLGKVTILVRDKKKAEKLFLKYINLNILNVIESDLLNIKSIDSHIDHIIHAASPTQPEDFINNPVGIIETNVYASNNLLKIARKNNASFCLLSTLEVYGEVKADKYPVFVKEIDYGSLDSTNLRSAYPESKRLAENLCVAHSKQFNTKTVIIRLAPVISPIIERSDSRVFAKFIRNCLDEKDIDLYSDVADSKRSYTYVADASTAILLSIFNEASSNVNVYNVANNHNIVSLGELANIIINTNKNTKCSLNIIKRTNNDNTSKSTGLIALDSEKISQLGWKSERTIESDVHKIYTAMSTKNTGRI